VLSLDTHTAYYVATKGESYADYKKLDGQWKHIDAGKGALWAVNLYNEVYQRLGIDGQDESTYKGNSWERVRGT
jgi:hypothetical protein